MLYEDYMLVKLPSTLILQKSQPNLIINPFAVSQSNKTLVEARFSTPTFWLLHTNLTLRTLTHC